MENNKKPYDRVYMTKLCRYFFRRYRLILLLLFAHPAIATMEKLDQVDFHGMGHSESKTITVTFMPDVPIYMFFDGQEYSIPEQVVGEINSIYALSVEPERVTDWPERLSWADMFAYSARLANYLPTIFSDITKNDFQFAAEDPLFGRVSGHTFRYHRHRTLTLDTIRVIRLIFLQQDTAQASEIHSIYIDLHVDVPELNTPNHIPFVVHAVRFNRGGQLVDGFHTQENIAAYKQAEEQAKLKRDSDDDQSKKEPEPPSKKDPPEGSEKEGKTGSNKRHWQFSSGGGGGGCACSMVQFFIMATLLIIPSCQQVIFYPGKA